MNCIDEINQKKFTLHDVYQFENDLEKIHQIRQQLQFLRDKGYLDFVKAGKYRLK